MWQATTIDEYSRLRAANIGATAATWGYSTTTNMLTQINGTGVQQYDYDFNGATGNLNWRGNGLNGKSETFAYDQENLDRLTYVTGTPPQTIDYDPTIKGNIIYKTDAGTYAYDTTRKYAVKTITDGVNISSENQEIVYNAFNKVKTITEGTKTADFVYNADRQRIRMTLKTSGATTKTRYYFGGSCEREIEGSTTTQYIWIGGDAYTAAAVAKKVGTGSWTVYNIFRDHLGTITHLKTGSAITEYSYDAWGRRRNALNWTYDLTGQPALFADRGFTGHEFLSDFNLYNMNGRLYDPVVGRFLSPDPYIADPSFSQSYNRYSYALNNPLKYNDPGGEFPWLAAGIFAGFTYLKTAYDNRDQLTGKWAWNPKNWFGKDKNTTFVVGINTNTSFSNVTGYAGVGVGPYIPAFAVNSNNGVGFGVYTPQGADFVYSGVKQRPEYNIVISAITKAREYYGAAWMDASNGGGKNLSLFFTGNNLSVWSGNKVIYSTPATSGKGEHMNNSNSQYLSNLGPIPEGTYSFYNNKWESQSTLRQVYNIIAGNGDWGDYNVPLNPINYQGSRHSFYLHGGFFKGSAGCIDAGVYIDSIYYYFKNQNVTYLRVKY